MVKVTVHDAEYWVTVHPNGKEHKGQPLLIEGSGGHYVVKGGAGGKLNGKTVNPKSMSKARKGTEGGGEPQGEEETPEWAKVKKREPTPEAEKPHAAPLEAEGFAKSKFDNFYRLQQNKENGAYHRLTVKPLQNKETGEWQYHLSLGGMSHTTLGLNGLPEVSKGSFKTVPELMQRIGELKNEYGFMAKGQKSEPPKEQPKVELNEVLKQNIKTAARNSVSKDPNVYAENVLSRMFVGGMTEAEKTAAVEYYKEQHKIAKQEATSLATKFAKEANAHNEERARIKAEQQKVGENRKPYAPQKTAKAAAKFAMDNNLADYADYGKLDAETANAMNESVQRHYEFFPMLREKMKMIGSCQKLMQDRALRKKHVAAVQYAELGYSEDKVRDFVSRIRSERVNPNWYAFANSAQGIGYNEKWGSSAELSKRQLQRDVESKWHPIGTGTQKGIIDHEMGHQVDYLLGLSSHPEVLAKYKELKNPFDKSRMADELSGYAADNPKEFVAEAWSEYLNNPNPRPVAKMVGDLARKLYAQKYRK